MNHGEEKKNGSGTRPPFAFLFMLSCAVPSRLQNDGKSVKIKWGGGRGKGRRMNAKGFFSIPNESSLATPNTTHRASKFDK